MVMRSFQETPRLMKKERRIMDGSMHATATATTLELNKQ
jgi:hypothetical protein